MFLSKLTAVNNFQIHAEKQFLIPRRLDVVRLLSGDEMDEGSEAYLPEELLSLLDAGLRSDSHGSAVIDGDNLYASGEGFDYVVARDIARRRVDRG